MHTISGDNSLRDPPVPIPNTEVKPQHADGTWLATARESRSSPDSIVFGRSDVFGAFFYVLQLRIRFNRSAIFRVYMTETSQNVRRRDTHDEAAERTAVAAVSDARRCGAGGDGVHVRRPARGLCALRRRLGPCGGRERLGQRWLRFSGTDPRGDGSYQSGRKLRGRHAGGRPRGGPVRRRDPAGGGRLHRGSQRESGGWICGIPGTAGCRCPAAAPCTCAAAGTAS